LKVFNRFLQIESVMSQHHNPIPKVDFLLYREDVLLVK
jgi:hypothetical protein